MIKNRSYISTSSRLNLLSSCLEGGLPVSGLYELAQREGNSKRPIYQIHKWWARRLGSVFRMLLIAAFSPNYEDLFSLWKKYYNGFSLEGKVIYDPCFGGGTSAIEALRLGCRFIGVDINPVAWFVTKKEIEPFNLDRADKSFKQIESNVAKKIRGFYRTRCPRGHFADVVYAIWIHNIKCVRCGYNARLFRDHIVREFVNSNGESENREIICPFCLSILKRHSKIKQAHCTNCTRNFAVETGVVSHGIFTCPVCKTIESLSDAAERYHSPLSSEMVCIQYYCEECGEQACKKVTDFDRKSLTRAAHAWHSLKKSLLYPKQRIPLTGRENTRLIKHGYRYYYELFNERQLLCLSLLLKSISKVKDEAVKEFLLLAFSNALETNNGLCKYESRWNKVSALFGVPGYHVVERYAEGNVWGTKLGRGSFVKCYNKMRRAKIYVSNTYELYHKGKKRSPERVELKESVAAKVVNNYRKFTHDATTAILICGNSKRMRSVPANSVDMILTDPPYYDNLSYAALADFFYVWLRLLLRKKYKWFEQTTSARTGEIVATSDTPATSRRFGIELARVFNESRRILKDDGLLAFTFHQTNPRAWHAIHTALMNSGFTVTAVPVVRSEGNTGYTKTGSIKHDACVVCRKSEQPNIGSGTVGTVLQESFKVAKQLKIAKAELSDADLFTILLGQGLRLDSAGYSEFVRKRSVYLESLKLGLRAVTRSMKSPTIPVNVIKTMTN